MLIGKGPLLASASCVALLGTVSAYGQDQVPTPESVVVTGTRIIQNGYEAPTPVTVAPVEQLQELAPTTIPDALNKLPVFAGSTFAESGSNGSGIAGNYLNLRDFGINRTLILMNGLRVAPTNFNGQVDVNSIPQLLLQRVDIVTGGASAVYGSDAVTGVVNFVMDTHFNGIRALAQAGESDHGDAGSVRYGIAAGSDLFNLGHIEFSFEQFQEGGLLNDQRSFSADRWVYTGTGTAASPYTLTKFGALAKTAFGGYVQTGPFAGQQFLANGLLGPFNPGTPTASTSVVSGGDAAYYNNEPLLVPQDQHQIYGRFDHDITPDVSFFVQATDTWDRNSEHASNWPAQTLTFFSGNPFLPASAQAALTAAKAPSPDFSQPCGNFSI